MPIDIDISPFLILIIYKFNTKLYVLINDILAGALIDIKIVDGADSVFLLELHRNLFDRVASFGCFKYHFVGALIQYSGGNILFYRIITDWQGRIHVKIVHKHIKDACLIDSAIRNELQFSRLNILKLSISKCKYISAFLSALVSYIPYYLYVFQAILISCPESPSDTGNAELDDIIIMEIFFINPDWIHIQFI